VYRISYFSRHDGIVAADIKARLGKRIRSLRLEKGWSQVEMADLLGMNRGYLSEIETGKKDPSLTMLKILADGLSIPLSKLVEEL
jgi:transcriptional regulator with XRE-family HTH domain